MSGRTSRIFNRTARPAFTLVELPAVSERESKGFTLVELLVVVAIIALLLGILLPALGKARHLAQSTVSLTNLRQMGIAISGYTAENNGMFPIHSSSSSASHPAYANPRTRWPDHLWPYNPSTSVYSSPLLTEEERQRFNKAFAHTVGTDEVIYHGGYGYNFQYLGNSRWNPVFQARIGRDVIHDSSTVVVADVAGSRKGSLANLPGHEGEAVYSLDPPLPGRFANGQLRAHRDQSRAYYASGSSAEPNGTPETYVYRSFPAARNSGNTVNAVFADGHAEAMNPNILDGLDASGNGTKNNKYFNGKFDENVQ